MSDLRPLRWAPRTAAATLTLLWSFGGTPRTSAATPSAPGPSTSTAPMATAGTLDAFFEALLKVETKSAAGGVGAKARITVWGDSAIVSDGFTGRLRTVLQERFGDGGPGFLHVAPTFKGYWHRRVRVTRSGWDSKSVLTGAKKRRYGLAGVSANGFGGANTTYRSKDVPFDGTVEVFYEGGPRGGNVAVYTAKRGPVAKLHNTRTPKPTDGRFRWRLPAPTSWLRVRAGGGGAIRVYGVALEQRGPGVVVDTLGVVGLRGRRILKNPQGHLAAQVSLRSPNLLVLAFGGNERVDGMPEQYHREGMVKLMKRLKSGAPSASCLFLSPIPHGKRKRGIIMDPRMAKITRAQAAAAKDVGCAHLDPALLFGSDANAVMAHFKKERWIGGDLAHLTKTGHDRVGDAIAAWLTGQYDAWKTQKANPSEPASPASPSPGSDAQ